MELIGDNLVCVPEHCGTRPMADIVYHLRQASTLTRYARLTRNPERAAELLRLAEQHKRLAAEEPGLSDENHEVALAASERALSTGSCT
jgi:hypothetical protein